MPTRRVLGLVALALTGAAPGCAADLTFDEQVEQTLRDVAAPGLAACVVKGGAVAWCQGYGHAEVETGRRFTPETPFMIASVSKLFTSIALMQRWEAGDFELDGDISTIVGTPIEHPRYPDEPITYQRLLTHQASIFDSDATDGFYTRGADPTISLEDAMLGYFTVGGQWYHATNNFMEEPPGSIYEYSNMGMALVGYLAGLHAGMDFAEYCDAEIFAPLEMTSTSWRLSDFGADELALPYGWDGDRFTSYGHYTFADYPNGGLRTSARSLARLLITLAGDGSPVLEPATLTKMKAVASPSVDGNQGLGLFYRELEGERWFGHDGGEDGVFTELFIRERDGLGFVLLINGDVDDEEDPFVARAIEDLEAALVEHAESL